MTPLVTVIVTYHRPTELALILKDLETQTLVAQRTIVVDNDPHRGAESLVSGSMKELHYLPTGANLGPAGGLQAGIREALREGFEGWVLCVDDDNYPPDETTVEKLYMFAEQTRSMDAQVGGAGLSGARFDGSRGRIRRLPDDELSGCRDVDYLPGNQYPLYHSEALREVGAHDPSLFFGYDDLELGLRFRRADWRLVVDGDELLRLRRRYGTTGGGVSTSGGARRPEVPWRRYYSSRNLVQISRSYCTPVGRMRASLAPLVRGLIDIVQRRPSCSRLLLASIRGVFDGWRGRTGRSVDPT